MTKVRKFKLNKKYRDDEITKKERRRRNDRRKTKEGRYNG
jgi:hypothetical protein